MTFVLPPVGSHLVNTPLSDWDYKLHTDLEKLTQRFQHTFDIRVMELNLAATVARGRFPCNTTHVLDEEHLWLLCEVAHGAPYPRKFNVAGVALSEDQIERVANDELGYIDPFFAKLSRRLIQLQYEDEDATQVQVLSSVDEMLTREYQRFSSSQRRIRISPLFGDPPL